MDNKYIHRQKKSIIIEKTPGIKLMEWLYEKKSGNLFLELIIKRKFLSVIYGKIQDFSFSRKKISSFIESYEIDMSLFEKKKSEDYKSFNDFFTRKLDMNKRFIDLIPESLISPADSKALFFTDIDDNISLPIKGFEFTLSGLLDNENLFNKFLGGSLAIFRLAPADYHRFHFIDNSKIISDTLLDGYYYSVHPISLERVDNLYSKNKRELTLTTTENFGDVAYIDVGATFVGSIIQTYSDSKVQLKGSEKGYFKFGGSTVILLFEKNKIIFDSDLLKNTSNGYETYVQMGEKIGNKCY